MLTYSYSCMLTTSTTITSDFAPSSPPTRLLFLQCGYENEQRGWGQQTASTWNCHIAILSCIHVCWNWLRPCMLWSCNLYLFYCPWWLCSWSIMQTHAADLAIVCGHLLTEGKREKYSMYATRKQSSKTIKTQWATLLHQVTYSSIATNVGIAVFFTVLFVLSCCQIILTSMYEYVVENSPWQMRYLVLFE